MLIWLINPYGPIPGEGWRDYRFTLLGSELRKRGHKVIWWTANFSHHFKNFRSCGWETITITDNFQIRLVPTTHYNKNIGFRRLLFEIKFAINVFNRSLKEELPPSIIIGIDPPQVVGFVSRLLAKKFKIPLILDIFDMWPELFFMALPSFLRVFAPIIFFPFFFLRKRNLIYSNGIVALCNTYLDNAVKVGKKNTDFPSEVIFNGIDLLDFRENTPRQINALELKKIYKKNENEIWAIFAGSLGPNYDIKTLLELSHFLYTIKSKIKILIAGDGPFYNDIISFINNYENNLVFLGKITHDELINIYSICDIGLCAYGPFSNVAMPDKVYDYMAAGLPVVNSLKGELEKLILNYEIGLQYRAGEVNSLFEELLKLSNNLQLRNQLAKNSYNLAEKFDSSLQYSKYCNFIEQFI